MKDIWTKVLTASAAAGMSVLLIGTAAIASTASNTNTGADSTNNAEVSVQNNTQITSNNNANITNNLNIYANTGKNEANKNVGGVSIQTGDITGSVNISNNANGADVLNSNTNLVCCDTSQSANNEKTGADWENKAKVKVKNNLNINVSNNVDLVNNVDADLNTGENEANKNTGDVTIGTGDINFEVNIDNKVNSNVIGGPVNGEPLETDDPETLPSAALPTLAPRPGQVLAAADGLPVTGSNLPTWPFLLVAIGFAARFLEKFFRIRFGEEAA